MTDTPMTSSYCTNWQAFNTPRLWAMVAGEDNPDAWRQVAAWGTLAGTVDDARNRLVQARDNLAAAWPPATNASADAFVGELNTLIRSLADAKNDADSTASGLANILEALRQAKDDIEPLYTQYREKSDDLVPDWWDKAEDEIDDKARQRMVAAESLVQKYVPALRVPEPFKMKPIDLNEFLTDEPPGGTPRISPGGGTGGGTTGGVGGGSAFPIPHNPVPPLPGHLPTVPDAGSIVPPGGIDLAGGAPPVAPPVVPPSGGIPGGVPPVIGGPAPTPIMPPMTGVIGGGGGGGGSARPPLGTIGGGGATPPGGYAAGRATPRAAGRGVLPSGAVIGDTVAGRAGGGAAGRAGAPGMSSLPGQARGGAAGGMSSTPGQARGGAAGGMSSTPGQARGGAAGRAGAAGMPGVSGRAGGGSAVPGGAGMPGVSGRAGAGSARPGSANVPGGGGVRPGAPGEAGLSGRAGGGSSRGARPGAKPTPPSWLPEDRPTNGSRTAAGPVGSLSAAGRRSDKDRNPPFDPDNPWGVASGVDPVIAPSHREARHDPGPNVIGYHG